MMELEIKHLATYLPFRLKVLMPSGEIGTVGELNTDRTEQVTCYDTVAAYASVNRVKPILYPMSEGKSTAQSLEMWMVLFKAKSDVFGLINQGLAVDVNTLPKNPYEL